MPPKRVLLIILRESLDTDATCLPKCYISICLGKKFIPKLILQHLQRRLMDSWMKFKKLGIGQFSIFWISERKDKLKSWF